MKTGLWIFSFQRTMSMCFCFLFQTSRAKQRVLFLWLQGNIAKLSIKSSCLPSRFQTQRKVRHWSINQKISWSGWIPGLQSSLSEVLQGQATSLFSSSIFRNPSWIRAQQWVLILYKVGLWVLQQTKNLKLLYCQESVKIFSHRKS